MATNNYDPRSCEDNLRAFAETNADSRDLSHGQILSFSARARSLRRMSGDIAPLDDVTRR